MNFFYKNRGWISIVLLLCFDTIGIVPAANAIQFKELVLNEDLKNPWGQINSPRGKIKSFLIKNHYIAANENKEEKRGGYGKVFLYNNIVAKIFHPHIAHNHPSYLNDLQENQLNMKALLKNKGLPNYSLCFPNEIIKTIYGNAWSPQNPEINFMQIMPKVKGKTLWDILYDQNAKAVPALDIMARLGDELGKFQKAFLVKNGKDLATYCHHDFHFNNIMLEDKTNKFKLIDLDFLALNHPLVDPIFFLMRLNGFDGHYADDLNSYQDERLHHTVQFLIPYLKQFDTATRQELVNDLKKGHQHILSCYANINLPFPLPEKEDGTDRMLMEKFDLMLKDFCDYLSLPAKMPKEQATLGKIPNFRQYQKFHSQIINMVYDLHHGVNQKCPPAKNLLQETGWYKKRMKRGEELLKNNENERKKQAQIAAQKKKDEDAKKQAQIAAQKKKAEDAKKQAQVAAQRKKAEDAKKKQAQVAAQKKKIR